MTRFFAVLILLTSVFSSTAFSADSYNTCMAINYGVDLEESWKALKHLSETNDTLKAEMDSASWWIKYTGSSRPLIYDQVFDRGAKATRYIKAGNTAALIDEIGVFMADFQHTYYQVKLLRQLIRNQGSGTAEQMTQLEKYENHFGHGVALYHRLLKVLQNAPAGNMSVAVLNDFISSHIRGMSPKETVPPIMLIRPMAEEVNQLSMERMPGREPVIALARIKEMVHVERSEGIKSTILAALTGAGSSLANTLAQTFPASVPVLQKVTKILNDFVGYKIHYRAIGERFFKIDAKQENVSEIVRGLEELHGKEGRGVLVTFFRHPDYRDLRVAIPEYMKTDAVKGFGSKFLADMVKAQKRAGELGLMGKEPNWTMRHTASLLLTSALGACGYYSPESLWVVAGLTGGAYYSPEIFKYFSDRKSSTPAKKETQEGMNLAGDSSGELTDAEIAEIYKSWTEVSSGIVDRLVDPKYNNDLNAKIIREAVLRYENEY